MTMIERIHDTRDDDLRVREAVQGVRFPADRDEVLEHAAVHGGLDGSVLALLRGLPDRRFSTADDVVISVP